MNQEDIQAICMQWPGVTEDIKWGADLVFSVGDRMFCVTGTESPLTFSFKVPDEDFESWTEMEGVEPAPYMARAKWVYITKHSICRKAEWEKHLKTSYLLVAAKLTAKKRVELGIVLTK